jgi:hypothetical protein
MKIIMAFLLAAAASLSAGEERVLTIPWSPSSFSADEGCRWQAKTPAIRLNDHYIAPPDSLREWESWLEKLRAYRAENRESPRDARGAAIELAFDGVRAWIRTGRAFAFAADLAPDEHIVIRGEARWLGGASTLCLAFDFCDRAGAADGAWRDWSRVSASAEIPRDGEWHDFGIAASVPAFDAAARWARPILGMDGTFDATRGTLAIRVLEIELPGNVRRRERLAPLVEAAIRPAAPLSRALYEREDLAWMTRNFVCGFVFVYDRSFWDPETSRYRVTELCADAVTEFGGFDSVVLWQAYPRIGADERNQFDFFRDMPGGLAGLRRAVGEFHAQGVKVFIPYNPWDQGTRREGESDDEALAHMVAALDADGIFLDTMVQAPAGLRAAVDKERAGVVFEPEGHPSIEELEQCNGSWAQWLQPFPGIGVLHLKWVEQRHMQHQIRRWDTSHREELAAAWLNGSGMLVWENIFGSWNPWNADDRATLRRMAPVLRFFAEILSGGEWRPYYPTMVEKVYASLWNGDGVRLWTFVNATGRDLTGEVVEVDADGSRFFDLWNGRELALQSIAKPARIRLPLALSAFGAIAGIRPDRWTPAFDALVRGQREESGRHPPETDSHVEALSVVEPLKPKAPARPANAPVPPERGMLSVDRGTFTFTVRHMRRECGCYPDPDTPRERWRDFLAGNPHDGAVEHQITRALDAYRIDPRPVTNGEFEAFLSASGYKPACGDRFLAHWGGTTCPAPLRDEPVVYVDGADARAYAAWAGARLPTEWEWQRAAEAYGDQFVSGAVHEWTDSERDDGHTRFAMLRGGSRYQAAGSIWYFPGGARPITSHAKFLLLYPGLDRCSTIGFRCAAAR